MKRQKTVVRISVLAFLLSLISGMGSAPIARSETLGPEQPLAAPDLVITDVWAEGDQICYQLRNVGDAAVPSVEYGNVLYVDSTFRASSATPESLEPGERLNRCFVNWTWQCSPSEDTVQVCADADDYVAESNEANNCTEETWLCDTTPPKIDSGPTVSASQIAAIVSWTTDEDSDSWVRYGSNAGGYDKKNGSTTLETDHQVALTGLNPATVYHYIVQSADESGNRVTSADGFFRTEVPDDNTAPTVSSFEMAGETLPLQFTADALDNVGVDRVEFSFDGARAMTDYDAPYDCYLDPVDLGLSRTDFFDKHEIRATAFDPWGLSNQMVVNPTLTGFCYEGQLELRLSEDIFYVEGEVLPPGTWVTLVADASETEWSYRSIYGEEQLEQGTPVAGLEFWVDDTQVYSSTLENTYYTYEWDAGGLGLGEHRVRAVAHGHDGCAMFARQTLTVAEAHPVVVVVDRTVERVGNYFTVGLTLRNDGQQDAHLITVVDRMVGFQSVSQSTDRYGVWASFEPASDLCTTTLFDFHGTAQWLPPDDWLHVEYQAVPVLYPGGVDYQIGVGTGEIRYGDPTGDAQPPTEFSFLREGDFFNQEVGEAISAADYLIVTNPYNLYGLHETAEADTWLSRAPGVDELLSKAAELATLRNGVLGYYYALASRMTAFNDDDKILVGDWFLDGKEETIVAKDDGNKILLYSARAKYETEIDLFGGYAYDLRPGDGVAVGDVVTDAYGKSDILIARSYGSDAGTIDSYAYLPALGSGERLASFASSYAAGDGLAAGDVKSGGVEEAIVANGEDGTVNIYQGTTGTLLDTYATTFEAGDFLVTGDVMGNYRDEIIYADLDANVVHILSGQDGTFLHSFSPGLDADDNLVVANLGGDSKEEIIIADQSVDQIVWYSYDARTDSMRLAGTYDIYIHSDDVLAAGDVMGTALAELLLARGESAQFRHAGEVEIIPSFRTEMADDKRGFEILINQDEEWARQLNGGDWGNGCLGCGYLLLIGEAEIIPAFRTTHDGEQVRYTDRYYASTVGHSWTPELAVGRIVGDTPAQMTTAIQTSLDIALGLQTWDNSQGLAVSGYSECVDGTCSPADFAGRRVKVADSMSDAGFAFVDQWDQTWVSSSEIITSFFSIVPGYDAILLAAHGSPGSWDPISNGAVRDRFEPGSARPLVFAASCLTGQYAAGFSMAEAFLEKGASSYIGATEVSYTPHNDSLSIKFFNRLTANRAVGDVFAEATKNYVLHSKASGEALRRYHQAIYHLYGDPKLILLPHTAGSGPQAAQPQDTPHLMGPLASVQVTVPDYEVTTIEGLDHVQIPGGDMLLEPGQPIVPAYSVVISYPQGTEVQSVSLITRTGLISDTGLNLPTTTLSIDVADSSGSRLVAEDPDFWPHTDFDWTVTEGPDGSTALVINLYPFFYNSQTTNVHFYKDYTFTVDYAASEVEIKGLLLDQVAYAQGETVGAEVYPLNAATGASDVVVEASIQTEDGELIAGLPLRVLSSLEGLASFAIEWDSASTEAGNYLLEVALRDMDGTLLDTATQMFTLGLSAGMITSFAAGPELFTVGDQITSSLTFENVGTVAISATAVIRVLDEGGAIVEEFRHEDVGVAVGSSYTFDDTWDTTGSASGDYAVTAYVSYDGGAAGPVATTVSSKRRLYLPLIMRDAS